jgi:hypothetical protein
MELSVAVWLLARHRSLIARDDSAKPPPALALDGLGVRELARRSIEIAIESLGIARAGAPAHARGHPTSLAIRGKPDSSTRRSSPT